MGTTGYSVEIVPADLEAAEILKGFHHENQSGHWLVLSVGDVSLKEVLKYFF